MTPFANGFHHLSYPQHVLPKFSWQTPVNLLTEKCLYLIISQFFCCGGINNFIYAWINNLEHMQNKCFQTSFKHTNPLSLGQFHSSTAQCLSLHIWNLQFSAYGAEKNITWQAPGIYSAFHTSACSTSCSNFLVYKFKSAYLKSFRWKVIYLCTNLSSNVYAHIISECTHVNLLSCLIFLFFLSNRSRS